jgi:hypothetical protein
VVAAACRPAVSITPGGLKKQDPSFHVCECSWVLFPYSLSFVFFGSQNDPKSWVIAFSMVQSAEITVGAK